MFYMLVIRLVNIFIWYLYILLVCLGKNCCPQLSNANFSYQEKYVKAEADLEAEAAEMIKRMSPAALGTD